MGAKPGREPASLRAFLGALRWLWRFLTGKPLPESASLILLLLGLDALLLIVARGVWQLRREGLTVLFFISQNGLTFTLFGVDRFIAPRTKGWDYKWRVSERNLLLSCLLGGALGGLLGMTLFRHKTGDDIRKLSFRWLVVATLVVNLLGLLLAFSVIPDEAATTGDGAKGPPAVEDGSAGGR